MSSLEELNYLSEQIAELPNQQLYENILTTLNSIERQLIIMDNRISKIEDRMRARDLRETNKNIRMYHINKHEPVCFVPTRVTPDEKLR